MAAPIYRFDEFRLDLAYRELWRGDDEVSLPPKAFGCLAYLVEHRDRAVGRDELIDVVWGKENLGDSVLGHAILATRRVLHDTGDEHRFIKTVQGFGYRWVAPVEIEAVDRPMATGQVAAQRRSNWLRLTLSLLAVGALALVATYLWRGDPVGGVANAAWQRQEGDIALLLPVTVDPDDQNSWIRFGVMELIAERLRDAGQPMVPSETVIALTRKLSAEPAPEELQTLLSTTGSRLVLGARVEATGTRWRVSVRGLNGDPPRPNAFAEAADVLEAARLAADRLAVALGLTAAPDPHTDPRLTRLLRQTEAAILAQQMDVARALIESADDPLRRHPRVRLQVARIELFSQRFDLARAEYESLLGDPGVRRDPVLRARVLHGLGIVQFRLGDHETARSTLREAMAALDQDDAPEVLGGIQGALGTGATLLGELDEARVLMAQARKTAEGTGDAHNLATLDNNRGVLEYLCERYADALPYFARAADLYAAFNDIGEELRSRANMIEVQLGLLEIPAASSSEPRLNELIAETSNPEIVAVGDLAKAALLGARGHKRAAEDVVIEVLETLDEREGLVDARTWALVLRAEQLAERGDLAAASRPAAEAIALAGARDDVLLGDYLGRARLVLLRTHLHHRDLAAASEVAARMSEWVERGARGSPEVYAALAAAEVAAVAGRAATAAGAFERALALADAGQVPLRVLQVGESYVPWLLRERPVDDARAERALTVAGRLARHADQSYRAARLQLRVYHALGPPSAWRVALGRARALAGEREIPRELLSPPRNP